MKTTLVFGAVTLLALVVLGKQAEGLPLSLIIQTENAGISQAVATPQWAFTKENVTAKLREAEELLAGVQLAVTTQEFPYYERRIVMSQNGLPRIEEREFKDSERQVALVLLNKKTGELSRITIVARGNLIMAPDGYYLEIVERDNGIQWNWWATQFRVVTPWNNAVLMLKFPYFEERPTRKNPSGVIKHLTYVPFSQDLNYEEFISGGGEYHWSVVQAAHDDLLAKKVKSRAVLGKLVTDVIPMDFVAPLPFLEQTDLAEMFIAFDGAVERVLGNLGYNGEKAYVNTCNNMGACGWVQFTNRNGSGTYSTIVRKYPEAKLIRDFKTGAGDHVNSMEAAMLLYDDNLALLVKKFGSSILKHPRLKELLAAAYNGSPSRVVDALRKAQTLQQDKKDNWIDGLLRETRGFITKLRQLQENDVPGRYLD